MASAENYSGNISGSSTTTPIRYFLSRLRSLAIYRRQDHRRDDGRASGRARSAHRQGRLGSDDRRLPPGYRYTAGPIVAKGKIIAGITGCERYKDDVCFISAHDPATGKELWRTSTIQRPGDPGPDTWSNLPLNRRAGSDVWMTGSYDPKLNLVYLSTANPKPWGRVSRKTDGDALYTNSTLALDPDTGKMVWYFQFTPGETHDIDDAFENMLIDHDGRQSLFKMGKLGILWELDRKTGKFVKSSDLGFQNVRRSRSDDRESGLPSGPDPQAQCADTGPLPGRVRCAGISAPRPITPRPAPIYIPIHPACVSETVYGGGRRECAARLLLPR